MLPRWLTALPRFAATWRDEILVVALGLAYQAGVAGTFGAPRHQAEEQVVVRIAAEQPRAVVATETHMMAEAHVATEPVAGRARTGCRHCRARAHAVTVAVAAPVVRVAPMPRAHPVAPARVRPARAPLADAGENVAADVTAKFDVMRVVVDTFTIPEVRASIARARAAMDEARVRAALQKALAAERTLPRAFQGPGA